MLPGIKKAERTSSPHRAVPFCSQYTIHGSANLKIESAEKAHEEEPPVGLNLGVTEQVAQAPNPQATLLPVP